MTTTTPRPDASMTLIREIIERPLDPGYAAAASRRQDAGLPRSTGLRSLRLGVMAVAIGLLFGVSAVTLNRDSDALTSAKRDLVGQIETARTGADNRAHQVTTLQTQIAAAEARGGDDLATRLAALESETAATPVAGPGWVITLDDAPNAGNADAGNDPRTTKAGNGGTVLARDVQIVSNALWEAGAEAMTINGQRISSRSAIRFAGDAILVNFRPLTRPYVIAAIGNPDQLRTGFASGAGGSYTMALRTNFGIQVSTSAKDRLTMPGATALTVRVARPAIASPTGERRP